MLTAEFLSRLQFAFVVSGIVMSFQFGTNWSGFSVVAGNVIGSLLAFAQGVILGTLVDGIVPLAPGQTHGAFAWFSPFAVMTSVAVACGYALLGATWPILKTEGGGCSASPSTSPGRRWWR